MSAPTDTGGGLDLGEYRHMHLTVHNGRILIQAEGDGRYVQAWANEVTIDGNRITWVLDGRDLYPEQTPT